MQFSFHSNVIKKIVNACLAALSATTLVACGGGGASTAASSLNLSGTAARGLALNGATIDVKCSSGGSTSTTASDDGTYSASIAGATLPCMLRATSSDGTIVYHSLADTSAGLSSGSTIAATVNVTPLTEIIMAKAVGSGSTPSDTFISNSTPPAVAVGNLNSAITYVVTNLNSAGTVDLTGFNPITKAFKAATTTTGGDSVDQKIDALMTSLSQGGQSVSDLSNVLVSSKDVQTDLKYATGVPPSDCPYARSGNYQFVSKNGGYTTINVEIPPGHAGGSFIVADPSWGSGSGTPTAEQNTFTWTNEAQCLAVTGDAASSASKQLAFSKGGVIVASSGINVSGTTNGFAIGFPVQTIPASSIANIYNTIEYDAPSMTGTAYAATVYGAYKIDASGNLTCVNNTSATVCANISGVLNQTANTDGSYTLKMTNTSNSATWNDKVFAYRGPDGQIMTVGAIANNGGMFIGSVQKPIPAPVGTVRVTSWETRAINPTNGTPSGTLVATYVYDKTRIDDTSYTRTFITKNSLADNWVDTYLINNPIVGFRKRPAVTYNGVSSPDNFSLTLPGNMAAFADGTGTTTSNTYFGLAVTLPNVTTN
jgi:hypothetical protein